MVRRIELVSGFAASVFGILGWAYAVFGPTHHYMGSAISSGGSTNTATGATSLAQNGLEPIGIVFFAFMALVAVSIAPGAYLHSRRGIKAGLMLLWTLTLLLWVSVILGAASIGVLLLPAALLAVVTVVAGSLAQAA